MKADLDRLMAARGLDAFVVAGGEEYSSMRDYMTNGASITGGLILKKQGAAPILVVSGMEVEEAAKSGLQVYTYDDFEYSALLQEFEGDMMRAVVTLWGRCLEKIDVHEGKIGIYGVGEINHYMELTASLAAAFPHYHFVGETASQNLFREAFLTKDADEIARLRSVAERTNAVLEAAWDFIGGHRADEQEILRKESGEPLTIGDVKRFVRRELLDRELEDTHMIFAQGRDGAFPHSRGEDADALRLGQAIVFDLFPRELGGGYFHDVTRTWCIGYAPEDAQKLYRDVMEAFDIAVENFGVNKPTHHMQDAVLSSFEQKGHPTPRSKPGTMEGYVHSLGHGVGLNIHEGPSIHHLRKEDIFQVGNCITIEPGLYYPEKGVGMRVEDLMIVTEAGELLSLSTFRKDLVLPLKNH